jgi:hypothetical protein
VSSGTIAAAAEPLSGVPIAREGPRRLFTVWLVLCVLAENLVVHTLFVFGLRSLPTHGSRG